MSDVNLGENYKNFSGTIVEIKKIEFMTVSLHDILLVIVIYTFSGFFLFFFSISIAVSICSQILH